MGVIQPLYIMIFKWLNCLNGDQVHVTAVVGLEARSRGGAEAARL